MVINKSTPTIELVFTVGEAITLPSSALILQLQSAYSSETFSFELPANTSGHPERYDLYVVSNSIFNDLKEGQYYYTIIQSDDDKILEVGLVELKSDNDSVEYISEEVDEAEDDHVVYEG